MGTLNSCSISSDGAFAEGRNLTLIGATSGVTPLPSLRLIPKLFHLFSKHVRGLR